jgi:predicted ATPase
VHDRIQEAVGTTASLRARRHLVIAHVIAAQQSSSGEHDFTFDVVRQYNLASPLIDEPGTRDRVAALNLAAAERSMGVMARTSAADYLAKGLSLLGEDA